jgi:hypothetical protein
MDEIRFYTSAYLAFLTNIERAGYFLDIHDAAHLKAGAPKLPFRELPRGAIVFAVGAIDAYLSEVSAEVIVHQLQQSLAPPELRELLRRVQSEVPALALEVALLKSADDRIQRVRDAIVDHFQNNVSNLGAKAVAAAAVRMGGKPADLWSALAGDGFADAPAELDFWTETRHEIVHQGKRPQVRKTRARAFIKLSKLVVERIDALAIAAKRSGHQHGAAS